MLDRDRRRLHTMLDGDGRMLNAVEGSLCAALNDVERIGGAMLDGAPDVLRRVPDGLGGRFDAMFDRVRRIACGVLHGVGGAANRVSNFAEEAHCRDSEIMSLMKPRVPAAPASAGRGLSGVAYGMLRRRWWDDLIRAACRSFRSTLLKLRCSVRTGHAGRGLHAAD